MLIQFMVHHIVANYFTKYERTGNSWISEAPRFAPLLGFSLRPGECKPSPIYHIKLGQKSFRLSPFCSHLEPCGHCCKRALVLLASNSVTLKNISKHHANRSVPCLILEAVAKRFPFKYEIFGYIWRMQFVTFSLASSSVLQTWQIIIGSGNGLFPNKQ